MISKPIVCIEDVRAHLPVRSGNDSFDTRITLMIATATQQIEMATRRAFTRQAHVEYRSTIATAASFYDFGTPDNESGVYYTARGVRYPLRGLPVDTGLPFTVSYDPGRVFGADSVLDAGCYAINAENGILELQTLTAESTQSLKFAYTAGYAIDTATDSLTASAPADLRLACITQVIHLFARTTSDNVAVDMPRGSKNDQYARNTNRGGLCPEAAAMVAHYRQPLLGLG